MMAHRLILLGFGDVLANIFKKLFNTILGPIITWALNQVLNLVVKLLREWFVSLWLTLWIGILRIIAVLEQVFNILSGVDYVTVNDAGTSSRSMGLLEALISRKPIGDAFLGMTAIALVLCFVATIIAVGASIADTIYENKRPISHVLKSAGKAGLTFLLVPFTCIIVLSLSSTMMQNMNTVFNDNPNGGMSDAIFVSVAQQGDKHNGKLEQYASGKRFANKDNVMADFNYKDFDYALAISSSVICFLIMLALMVQFIQRAILILLLYIVSPYFVAFIPLDDGQKFNKWRDMFVGNMLSAFSPILAMRIYMMICPMITSGSLSFPTIKDQNVLVGMQLVLVIGGAWAIFRSKYLILQLVSPQAAQAAQRSEAIAMGTLVMAAAVTKSAAGAVKGLFTKKGKNSGGGGSGGGESEGGGGGSSGGGGGSSGGGGGSQKF